jgi:glutathione synthase/RimK-type ligase-like ATP-grasp enzyme
MGLDPSWVTPNSLFAVTYNGQEQYINLARSPLNPHASISLARNKYHTRLILERHGMPNIPFTRTDSAVAALAFLRAHGKIIAKPVTGSGAHDIHIITTSQQLRTLDVTKYILEKYIVGQELRYLVLNGEVIGVHRSEYGVSVREDRPLERISIPLAKWDLALVSSAIQIVQALGLNFAAVDYLVTTSGFGYILEVNSTPGLKWFHAPTSGPAVNVARQFLEASFKHL